MASSSMADLKTTGVTPEGCKILFTSCGHVFHESCLLQNHEDTNGVISMEYRNYLCRQCMRITNKMFYGELDFQTTLKDTSALIEENKKLRNENFELRTQLNVSKLKLVMLGHNNQKISEQLVNLTWVNLTQESQQELRKKIEEEFSALNIHHIDLRFLKSETLFQLAMVVPDKAFLLYNLIVDYYDMQYQLHLNISLKNFEKLFKEDFPARFRVVCGVPSLDLSDVPVSKAILDMVVRFVIEEYDNGRSSMLLIDIAKAFFSELFECHINALYKIVLYQMVSGQLSDDIEIEVPYIDEDVLFELVNIGVLIKVDRKIEIANKLVKYFIIGHLVWLVQFHLKITLANARRYIISERVSNDSLLEYCCAILESQLNTHYNEHESVPSFIMAFDDKDADNIALLVILAVMKLSDYSELSKVLKFYNKFLRRIRKNIWNIEYPCIIKERSVEKFSLLCFAAVRGDMIVINELLSFVRSLRRVMIFDIAKLIHLCSSSTLHIGRKKLLKRKKALSFLITIKNHNGIIRINQAKYTPKTVNVELVRYIMQTSAIDFREIWSTEAMLQECALLLQVKRFCEEVACFYEQNDWEKFFEVYCSIR